MEGINDSYVAFLPVQYNEGTLYRTAVPYMSLFAILRLPVRLSPCCLEFQYGADLGTWNFRLLSE